MNTPLDLPLSHWYILNTRPQPQGEDLTKRIQQAGGHVIEFPVIAIDPVTDWFEQCPDLDMVHQAIFISANAVEIFFAKLKKNHMVWPASIHTIAVGHASARALKRQGIHPVTYPTSSDSEGILNLSRMQNIQNQTILHIKGEGGRPLLERTIPARGAKLITLEVYRRTLPIHPQSFIDSLWQERRVDIILLTSAQAIDNIFQLLGKNAISWLLKKPCLVISQRLANIASDKGIKTVHCCQYNDIIPTLAKIKTRLNGTINK